MRAEGILKMAGETLPLVVGAGVGVSVLAGVVSGVCYLIISGFGWNRRSSSSSAASTRVIWTCGTCQSTERAACQACLRPSCQICDVTSKLGVQCGDCHRDSAKTLNSEKDENEELVGLKEALHCSANSSSDVILNFNKVAGVEEEQREQSLLVRDFLQQLGERLAGGSLDTVHIGRMYTHADYLPQTESESASSAHARLQQLVQRVIEEALKLPPLLDYSGLQRNSAGRLPEFNPKTYEDLLATAIINKVIDRCQQASGVAKFSTNGASSSGVHSGSSSPGAEAEGAHRGRGRARQRSRRAESHRDDSQELSSLEPLSQDDYENSDSSGQRPRRRHMAEDGAVPRSSDDEERFTASYDNPVDSALSNMSFQYKDRVEFPEYGGDIIEIDETQEIDDESEGSHRLSNGNLLNSKIYANNNSWEENWLFQKKKMKSSQSGPVPMLIPNPNTDVRALIGDRDADDTTDLSDAGSETEENTTDIKQVLVNSKTIIGGKNPDIALVLADKDSIENGNISIQTETKGLTKEVNASEELSVTTNGKMEAKQKDENDNTSISHYHDDEIAIEIVLPTTNSSQVLSQLDDVFQNHREVPAFLRSTSTTTDAMRDFLRSLESEEASSDYEIIDYKTSSTSDENVTSLQEVNEATNLDVVDRKEDAMESLGNHQQESEYTETVAVPVQRHLDSLKRQHHITRQEKTHSNHLHKVNTDLDSDVPPPLPAERMPLPVKNFDDNETFICIEDNEIIVIESNIKEDVAVLQNGSASKFDLPKNDESESSDACNDLEKEIIPGSIAEREHKKWLNAVPMVNNPYSPEAIQNRLNKQNRSSLFEGVPKLPSTPPPTPSELKSNGVTLQSALSQGAPDFKRYGRDYYINEAKKATGARKRLSEMKFDSFPEPSTREKVSPLTRATSADPAASPFDIPSDKDVEANGEIISSKMRIEDSPSRFESLLYEATPVIVEDVESQFDDIYEKTFSSHKKIPLNESSEMSTYKMDLTNGSSFSESLDQSDSVSSVDESPRVYNIQTGRIVSSKSKLAYIEQDIQREIYNDTDIDDTCHTISVKSWKPVNLPVEKTAEITFEELEELPSVKDLARKFFVQETAEQPQIKPKRRISRELLDNEIVNKTLSNLTQHTLKQPQHMHSLTARSISKEFRDELKLSMPAHSNIHPGGSKNIPDGTEEPIKEGKSHSPPGSPVPEPGSLRNKLAFFEQLNKHM